MMKTVGQILQGKGHEIWSVTKKMPVFDALKKMAEKNIGALLVLEGDKLVGIMSERDYARKVILKGKSSKDTSVEDIMSNKVFYVRLDQSVEDCMALMTEKRVRHLPVLENDQLVGVISIGDVVKAVISEQEIMIEHLKHYIMGIP
ncbi:MAG: CBS domain-containing protein [Candidatus Marinimicrobia bacterium]|nr:CBS domain-containing protein [Candidatus Neomarinimicrobiota bacterium]MCH8068325.1 CBS domain-containing protein [Candidatus Neomarinimicrobiota bacterium]